MKKTRQNSGKKRDSELLDSGLIRESHLNSILNSILDIIFYLSVEEDEKYRFLFVNNSFLAVTGLKADQVIGKYAHEVIPEPAHALVFGNYSDAIKNKKSITWEEVSVYPTGEKIGLVTIVPQFDMNDKCSHLVGSVHDITERKLAEETLRESERKLREAQDMAHLGFWSWDIKTGEVEWSEDIYKIFGLDTKKFTPKIDSILAFSPWPEDHQRDKELINRAIENHGPGDYEQKFLRPDKSIGYYYSTFQGNYDEKGNLFSIVGTVLDITERKRVGEEIQKLNQELEKRVIERTSQLKAANQELQTFTYSVSHDLKAPLRGIDGYSRLLQELYSDKLNNEAQHFINTIRNSTRQMNQLIEDLLAYSRLERATFRTSAIKIKNFIDSIKTFFADDILSRKIVFTVKVPDTEITADHSGLTVALRNLVENAIKFSGQTKTPKIEILMEENVSSWILSVKDNGIGFDMKYHDRIFEIFQRLNLPELYPGTGIGLAMVRKAAQRMGGKVWAESSPGEGAVFYLEIPKQQLNGY